MIDTTSHRHAVAAVAGGVLVSAGLALDDVAPDFVGLAVVVPVLLGFGVLEIYGRYRSSYGPVGRAGVILTGAGLALLLVAILLFAVTPPVFYAVFLVAIAGVPALAALGLGSAFLAITLRRVDLVRVPTAVLLAIGVPLWPALTVLAGGVDGGPVLGPAVTAGVLSAFAGAPYGLGWTLVGYRLWETAGGGYAPEGVEPKQGVGVSPQVVTAGLVGGIVVLLNAGRFVPLGPLSTTPWVDHSLPLDVGQLSIGVVGVVVAAHGDARLARRYNQVVGLLAVLLVAVVYVGGVRGAQWLRWLPIDVLRMELAGILLALAAGLVLLLVGFGLSDGGVDKAGA